jgi:hypothetical protein
MFTWICPQCGREVPPSYTECPDCAARGGDQAAAVAPATPPAAVVIPPGAAAPAPAAPRAHGPVVPVWALSILLVLAIVGLGAAVYGGMHYFRPKDTADARPALEPPPTKGGKTNPYQRYVEVTGIRLVEDAKKKAMARFVVVNHSNAEIAGLEGIVTIYGRIRKAGEEAEGSFSFKLPSIQPFESKDLTAPVVSSKKLYEMPDWQNIDAQLQITAPAP